MRKLFNFIISMCVFVSISMGSLVYGASDGQVDVDSTGTLDVSLVIPERINIIQLSGINFESSLDNSFSYGKFRICIKENFSGTYKMMVYDQNRSTTDQFLLSNNRKMRMLPYNVYLSTSGLKNIGKEVNYNKSEPFASKITNGLCSGGGLNAQLTIKVKENVQSVGKMFHYADLIVVVEPG